MYQHSSPRESRRFSRLHAVLLRRTWIQVLPAPTAQALDDQPAPAQPEPLRPWTAAGLASLRSVLPSWRPQAVGLLLLALSLLIGCGNDKQSRKQALEKQALEKQATEPASPSGSDPAPAADITSSKSGAGTPSADDASAPSEPANPPSQVGGLGMVLATSLHVRGGPGMENASRGLLSCGDVVKIEEQQGEWYRIKVEDVQGWSHMAWLNPIRAGGQLPMCGKPEYVGKLARVPVKPVRNLVPPPPPPQEPQPTQHGETKPLPPATEPVTQQVVVLPPPSEDSSKKPTEVPRVSESKPVVSEPAKSGGHGPKSILLAVSAARPGKVTFPHHAHNQQFACAQCHHPVEASVKQQAKTDKACRTCHARVEGEGFAPFKAKDAFHKTCRDCHQTSGAGPTKCAECHTSGS